MKAYLKRSFAVSRSLPRKDADGQLAFLKHDRASSPSAGTEREAARESHKKANSADKLAQMTIEGDMRLHELILAGRADVAVLR